MKNQFITYSLSILSVLFLWSCQEDDQSFGEINAPSNISISTTVVNASEEMPNGDGSGLVDFEVQADNAINYGFKFGDGAALNASSDGVETHAYTRNGVHTYTVTVIAYGKGGTSSSAQTEVTVRSDFSDPETTQFLTGGSTKSWYVAKNMPAHLGVGPVETATPDFYSAAPNEKVDDPCFYNDELVFTLQDNGSIVYNLNNQGATFFNAGYLSVAGGSGSDDQCLPFDTSGDINAALASANSTVPADLTTGTQIVFNDNLFMSYYVGNSNYEILEISEDYMHVRVIQGNDPALAWYLKFTTDPEAGGGSDELETEFENLIWEENFDVDGAPDSSIWNFETGNNNGWGNQELQYYTEDNAVVENGVLKITAKAESEQGFDYTSSRLTTLDKFSFEYGRIEIRAKLPSGGGTWPALWMMGENFPDVGWPACGEIDIMEHAGNEQDLIHGSLHMPGNFGGNAISQTTTVAGVSDEFNNYTVEWSDEHIIFAVNDVIFHEYTNTSDSPFNAPFFIILNVAMGGTFGGDVDPGFTESTMEVDHIKVYQ